MREFLDWFGPTSVIIGALLACYLCYMAFVVATHRILAGAGEWLVEHLRAQDFTKTWIGAGRPTSIGRALRTMSCSVTADPHDWDGAVRRLNAFADDVETKFAGEALGEAVTEQFCHLKDPVNRDAFIQECRSLIMNSVEREAAGARAPEPPAPVPVVVERSVIGIRPTR